MTNIEKKNREFTGLMEQNGFRYNGKTMYDGTFIYERVWQRETELVWYGVQDTEYRIEASIRFGYPLIRIYCNGRELAHRDYSSPKRAINAMKEIMKYAGFEF